MTARRYWLTGGASVLLTLLPGHALAHGFGQRYDLPVPLWLWAAAAAVGGLVGSEFGSRWLGNRTLRRLLAVVLVIAGLKLILT